MDRTSGPHREKAARNSAHRWLPSRRRTHILVAAAAVVVTAAGLAQLAVVLLRGPGLNPTETATLGGLTAAVDKADWVAMDMSGFMPGYQMPAAMMPGMPADGEQRLSVTVTIVNNSGDTHPMRAADEFTLRTIADGKTWTPEATTFGELPRLGPANGVTGELYFDLPTTALVGFSAWLEWEHDGHRQALLLPALGSQTVHVHSS